MRRSSALVATCVVLLASASACSSVADEAPAKASARAEVALPKPRNVVLIVLDDVGVDLIGAYEARFRARGQAPGSPASTPAIDQLLAARGVTFTHAVTAPMCSPSRAQILTGRAGSRTGIGRVLPHSSEERAEPSIGLSLRETLLPTVLHSAPRAYTCAAVGKWHLASAEQLALDPCHPLGAPHGRWFDRYAGSQFNLQDPDVGPRSPTGYWRWVKSYATAIGPGVAPCEPPCDVVIGGAPPASYATVDTTDDALTLVATLPEPWFVMVAYNGPHAPHHVVPSGLPRATCGQYEIPAAPCATSTPPTTPELVRCMLSEVDAQIGRLLCGVDASDTVVILIGDNGTVGDATLAPYEPSHAKDSLYQGGIQVPLIVRSPDADPRTVGTACEALVSSTDLFATIAEIAGVARERVCAEDSISLLPYLRGASAALRRTVYVEEFSPNFTPDAESGGPPAGWCAERHGQALLDERFKLLRTARRDRNEPALVRVREQLFDLERGGAIDAAGRPTRDSFEQHDLLAHGEELAVDARAALERLRSELAASFPTLVR